MSALENQIRDVLAKYANRQMSFDSFLEWFAPISCNIEQSGDSDAIRLAHQVDGILAEASSADWSAEDIYEELSRPFSVSPFAENNAGEPSPFPVSRSQSSAANFSKAA